MDLVNELKNIYVGNMFESKKSVTLLSGLKTRLSK